MLLGRALHQVTQNSSMVSSPLPLLSNFRKRDGMSPPRTSCPWGASALAPVSSVHVSRFRQGTSFVAIVLQPLPCSSHQQNSGPVSPCMRHSLRWFNVSSVGETETCIQTYHVHRDVLSLSFMNCRAPHALFMSSHISQHRNRHCHE